MNAVNKLDSRPQSPPNLLKTVCLKFMHWYHQLAFRTALKVYEARISYFEIEGNMLEPFLFTGSLKVAYSNLMNMNQRHGLPTVSFETLVQMLQSGKPVRFQKGSRWVSLIAYLHK